MKTLVASSAVLLLAACAGGTREGSADSPLIAGDLCAAHFSETSCGGDSAHQCHWYPPGLCPTCSTYAECHGPDLHQGTSCTCSMGAICFVQIGGPAMQVDQQMQLQCAAKRAGCNASDICQCIDGQGRCQPHYQIAGACTCDNGIR